MRRSVLVFLFLFSLAAWAGGPVPPAWWDRFRAVAGPRAADRAAQVWAESGYRADAISWRRLPDGTRRPIAYGPAQFIPATWSRYGAPGASPHDPAAAIQAQDRYMRDLERLLGDWPAALGGYNAGPGNILRARRRAAALGLEGRDAWRSQLPAITGDHSKETLAYVPRVESTARRIRAWEATR